MLGKFLLKIGEKTISKIPLANSIFSTTKQISKIVFAEGGKHQQVVLVEYPRKGSWAVGFVTKENEKQFPNLVKFINELQSKEVHQTISKMINKDLSNSN